MYLAVFAAGSLRPAFDVLAEAAPLRIDYANARDLADRIVAGEAADVYASASPDHPRALQGAGLVDEPRPFASNRLVVAVPADSPARDLEVVAAPGTRLVIEVAGIPLGDYTRELLARLDGLLGGGFRARALANVVSQEQTVDVVASRLVGGQADAAVLYATDVAARPGQLRAIELPPGASVAVTCVACTLTSTTRREAAMAWIDSLSSPAAAAVMRAAGFGAPNA